MRACLAIMGVALLAACTPPAPPVAIRGGITQAINLDTVRPPSGVTYRYQMEAADLPFPVELRLTSRRRSANTIDYTGSMIMTLPQAGNLEEIGRLIARGLDAEDVSIGIEGNRLLVPIKVRTDNRFRSVKSQLNLIDTQFAPHDCFAVLGTCRYTATEQGRAVSLVTETTEENGVWSTRTRPDRSRGTRGSGSQLLTYSLDRNAVVIDMVITTSQGGQRSTTIFRRK